MKVLISGAGIAGLSLMLRLRQRGLTPVVVERSPRLRDGGYMLGLADPGLDAAARMRVANALRAARHMPQRLVYVDGDGRERFSIGGPALDRLVGERRFNLLRRDIEHVNYERVRGEVEVRFGAFVESSEERRDGGGKLRGAGLPPVLGVRARPRPVQNRRLAAAGATHTSRCGSIDKAI